MVKKINTKKIIGILTLIISMFFSEKINAQACGTCGTPNCTGVKQYANKTEAQGGANKVWKNYSPTLTSSTGSFTTYATIRTDANGQVGVIQELTINGNQTGLLAQANSVAATRTYKLFALSDASCTGGGLSPNIPNDGLSPTFNPAWTNLLPNTNYKLALTTNLSGLSAGYTYTAFNIRYYNAVRPIGGFTFNCGSSTYTGTFTANGTGGQSGTLTVPLASATAGSVTISVSDGGFSGSFSGSLAAGQASVTIPVTYDGSGAVGNHLVTVSSSQGTGTCSKNIDVQPVYATYAFACNSSTVVTGSFVANGTGGQTGSVSIPLANTTAGVANFTVSGGGFSGNFSGNLTTGQTSVTIPVTFDGSGAAGQRSMSVTSPQETGSCAATATIGVPTASFTFDCSVASVTSGLVANGQTNQSGFLTLALTGATAGTASFAVSGGGFSGNLTTTLVANQSSVTIPIQFDGSGVAGSRSLSVSSAQGSGTCSPSATIGAATSLGAITFNCPTTLSTLGTFVANGNSQTGMIAVEFTTQTAGKVSFVVSGGGFSGSLTTDIISGQGTANIPVTFDGSGMAGGRAISVASAEATGTCTPNVTVVGLFDFGCSVFNSASNFIANGTSQNGSFVIPLTNTRAGSATFAVTGGGFTGSATVTLRDSQRFVSIPVVFDGLGASGNHAVSVSSSEGVGTCSVNVWIKDPAMNGCDYILGENIVLKIHSNNTNSGFTTHYVLTDASNVIQYSSGTPTFSGVSEGIYTAFAVNYSGTAPTLTVGTALNAIGGTCTALSNAFPIKMCPAFTFNCGAATYEGTFLANGTGGQTGVLNLHIQNPLPVSTTFTVSGGGFSGTRTMTLTTNDTIVPVNVAFDGTGTGGVVNLAISATNGAGTCNIGVTVSPPPPAAPFSFDCASSVLDTVFMVNNAPQSGSVTVNLAGAMAGTVSFTVTGSTGFSGSMDNVVLTAGMTSLTIPVNFDGSPSAGNRTVTIASSASSNTCSFTTNVIAPCATPSVGGTAAYTGGVLCSVANTGSVALSGETGSVVKWQNSTDGGLMWTDIVNTTTTLNFTNAANGTQYRAVVNNGGGCVDANSTPITVSTSAANCVMNCNVGKPTISH